MDNSPLTAQDRCDRCGAPAQARTTHVGGPLTWCAHHLREHDNVLMPLLIWQTPEIAAAKTLTTKH
jgi:recombinational DNA repair protein (RecF pathway)